MTATEERLNDAEKQIVEVEARSRSNTKRLDEVEGEVKENRNLLIAINNLAAEMKQMRETMDQTIARLSALEKETVNEDAEKWKKFTWYGFITIVGILIGYVANQLGLK